MHFSLYNLIHHVGGGVGIAMAARSSGARSCRRQRDTAELELNDEPNVLVASRTLASQLVGDFERDLTRSKRISLDEWRHRPPHIRASEKLWSYFGEIF